MTIENLGVKLYSGTKTDRKSDSLGSSADGSNTGINNPNYSSNGLEFTGGEYVEVNGLRSTISGATSISMACWINPSDITDGTILGFWNSGYEVIIFSINGSNKLQLVTKGADGSNLYMASSASISADTLAHVAFTYDTSGTDTVKLYINGALDSTHTTNVPTSFPSSSTGNVYIGSHSAGTNYFDGTIKQYLVYSDVLTLTEIQTLYNSGTPVTSPSTSGLVSRYDFTANANDSQGSNNGTSSAIKLGTGAYSLNGTSSKILCGSASDWKFLNDGSTSWTITAWLKNQQTGGDKFYFSTGETNAGLKIGSNSSGNFRIYTLNSSAGVAGISYTSSANFNPDSSTTWNHFAFVYDKSAGTFKVYKNGTADSTTGTINTFATDTPAVPLTFGKDPNADDDYTRFEIDDMGIFKRALSATEIGKLANNNGAGWLTKDAQATTNTSSSGTTLTNSSFTVANNSNRILIVCAYRYGSGGDISGITWNGTESFTRATFRDGSTETGRTEIWYLVNPTATTANVVTTWDASTDRRIAGVYSFYNAKQTSPIGATAYDDEITTVTDGAITPTEEGSMIVDCIGSGSNGAPNDSLTAGWSVLIGGDDRIGASQYKVNPTIGSANTMAWTFASDKGVNWIAVEVKSANPTGSSAQLVSSLTDKSNLKAYYSMDSTSLNPSVSKEWDGSTGSTGFTSSDTGDKIAFTNNRAEFTAGASGLDNTEYGYDLGVDVTGDYFMDFELTGTNTAFCSVGQGCQMQIGLASTTGNPSGGTPSMTADLFKVTSFPSGSYCYVYLQAKNSSGTNTVGDQTNSEFPLNSTNTNLRYGRLSRTGTTLKIEFFTDSDRTASVGSWTTTSETGKNVRYLFFKVYTQSTTNAWSFYADNFKFYNGSGSPDGCKNDFSSTSDLEALSGVRTSSIFQQTDDTPSYWWYQSDGTWKLDGSVVSNTDMTTSYTGYTGNTGDFSYDSSENGIKIDTSSNNKIIVKTLSKTLSKSGKWVARFKVKRNTGDAGDGWGIAFTSSSASTVSQIQSGGYFYGLGFYINNGSTGGDANSTASAKKSNGSDDGSSSSNMTTDVSIGDNLYIELRHLSDTSFICTAFSDSTFETSKGSVTRTYSEQEYDYDQIAFWTKWGSSAHKGIFEDLEVQSGTSEWLE
jgi:hypothetical protein